MALKQTMDVAAYLADPDWVLANFTLAADLTALREECRFVYADEALVARYEGLPFAALSFLGESPEQIAELAAQLVTPRDSFYLLVNEHQAELAERAFAVEQVQREWQMVYTGDSTTLNPGNAVPLRSRDISQIRDLAENAKKIKFERVLLVLTGMLGSALAAVFDTRRGDGD